MSSNYTYDLAPKTWEFIEGYPVRHRRLHDAEWPDQVRRSAPQKIAYLAADHWRKQGVLDKIDVHLVLPTPGMFGVPVFAKELEKVVAGYGINVHFSSELESVDADGRRRPRSSRSVTTMVRASRSTTT